MKEFLLVLSCLLLTLVAWGKDKDYPTNMKFYHVDVEISLDSSYIKGKTYCEFVATTDHVNELVLDLADQLKVSKVEGASSFEQRENKLYITLEGAALKKEQRANVTVHYEGVPPVEKEESGLQKGLVYSTHGQNDNPVIATVCYPDGSHLWFPCNKGLGDKVDSLYMDITIEKRKVKEIFKNPKTGEMEEKAMPIIAVSNGVLEKVARSEDGTKKQYRWRHRHRIAPHHILIAISNFTKIDSKFKGKGYRFPINFYIFPEKYKESSAMIRRVPEIMACLTNTFGPYPYRDEVFNVTQVGIDLGEDGMPTQTNVLLEDMKSVHMYKVVHQMASMWFGNHISPRDWQDAWITEALATYSEAMWQEYKRGLAVYQIILDEKEYFEGGKLYLDNLQDYEEERLSKKGFYAIHMLRGIMTDTYFFETLKAITSGKAINGPWSKTYLSTQNFKEICEYYASENIERDYSYFFDQWVHGEQYPEYKVAYRLENGKVVLNVNQEKRASTPDVFTMPYKIEIELEDGTRIKKIINENQNDPVFKQANQQFEIPVEGTVKRVHFDPANWIFKDLKYVKQVYNERFAMEGVKIETADHRRKIIVSYTLPKKQDVAIELFQVANGVDLLEDKSLNLANFKKDSGSQKRSFEIPLDKRARGVYRIELRGKGESYSKVLRLKRIAPAFK
ncbi:MAG: M1 family aminopeptidase [Aureispira sp.]